MVSRNQSIIFEGLPCVLDIFDHELFYDRTLNIKHVCIYTHTQLYCQNLQLSISFGHPVIYQQINGHFIGLDCYRQTKVREGAGLCC